MVSTRMAKAWLEKNRAIFYVMSFVTFWIAISLQSTIAKILADKVSADLLNITTVFIMWTLAVYILPIIGAVILVFFLLRSR